MSKSASKKVTRRRAIATLAAGAGSLSAASLGARSGFAQSSGPIKIGYMAPLSGAVEVIGKAQLLGAQIAIDEINKDGGVLGRKLELVIRDDKSDPAVGAAIIRELAGSGSNLIAGGHSSAVMLAILPVLAAERAVFVTQGPASPALTHENFSRNLFRPTDYNEPRQRALAKLAAETAPNTDIWGTVLGQLAVMVSMWEIFEDGLLQYYPKIAKKQVTLEKPVFVPAGSPDYRNGITQAARIRSRGLFLGLFGADTITFLRQAAPYKLLSRFECVCDPGSEWDVPQTLKKDTPKGYWTGHHWYFGAYENNPISRNLYAEIVRRTGVKYPKGYTGEAHTAILALANGIKRAQSTDTEAVIKAMEGMSFDTCKNRRTIRAEDHQADADANFVRFEPDDTEQGWKISEYRVIKGADVLPPPGPGKPAPLNYLKKG